jgi:hypothetical protein
MTGSAAEPQPGRLGGPRLAACLVAVVAHGAAQHGALRSRPPAGLARRERTAERSPGAPQPSAARRRCNDRPVTDEHFDSEQIVRLWNLALDAVVPVELTKSERELLARGLLEWGGPARPSDAIARVIGFEDVETMHREGARIRRILKASGPLTKRDLQAALIATEIVWSSNFYGAAFDWEMVTGWDDATTLSVLRGLQSKLLWLRNPPRRQT